MQKNGKNAKKNGRKCMFNFKNHAKKGQNFCRKSAFSIPNSYKKGKDGKKKAHFLDFFCFYNMIPYAYFYISNLKILRQKKGTGDQGKKFQKKCAFFFTFLPF